MMKTRLLCFFSIFVPFLIVHTPIHASDNTCPLLTASQPPLHLRIMRAGEKVLPFFLMDPTLQVNFLLSQAKRHNHSAMTFRLTHPSLGYQELLRSIDALTHMEKPIRTMQKKYIPIDTIKNTVGDIELTIENYKTVYDVPCNSELTTASSFLLRNTKTLEKLYYESLLITTQDIPCEITHQVCDFTE